MISGIVTGVLLLAFLGIAAWAYSSRQRQRFDEAARLPLDDEALPTNKGRGADRSADESRQWTLQ